MFDVGHISGEWTDPETPDWTALEALLPLELCGPFMWIAAVQLEDGRRLGVYKHHTTRRYLYLDSDGATFGYRGERGYCRIRHSNALEHVFDSWWLLTHASEAEKAALSTAFEEADKRDHADFDAGMSLPPSTV